MQLLLRPGDSVQGGIVRRQVLGRPCSPRCRCPMIHLAAFQVIAAVTFARHCSNALMRSGFDLSGHLIARVAYQAGCDFRIPTRCHSCL